MLALRRLFGAMRMRDQRRLIWLTVGLAAAGLVELLGVASVIPFLALVGNSTEIGHLPWVVELRSGFGITSDTTFLLIAGVGALLVILASSVINAALTYAQLRFTHRVGYDFARRLLDAYVGRERLFFVNANSADLARNVLAETDRMVGGVLTPLSVIASRLASAIAVIGFLLAYAPGLALVLGGGFGGLYVLLYILTRARLAQLGTRSAAANDRRFRAVHETLGALTELKIYGRAEAFAAQFDNPARAYAHASAASLVTGQAPRFVIEALAFGGVIAVVLFALAQGLDTGRLLPLLGLFAFAGYRLLPAFQNVFASLALVRFNLPALSVIVDEISRAQAPPPRTSARLPFIAEVRFENVGFAYEVGRPILTGIDLTITANRTIGIAGRTGSGKSTLIALLLGLTSPTQGRVVVDGQELNASTTMAWQNRIGYVPQDIFLVDGTITENIALGLGNSDPAAIERAARLAGAHEFVAALPHGYGTRVGERGTRLSGGQRQRLGIARALYHQPDVIVFDEATSALDGETEAAVMEALAALAGTRTIVMIAHRLTSLVHTDVVHVMEEGRIVASGPLEVVRPLLTRRGSV